MTDRSKLPFRETSDVLLIYDGKIVALDKGKYVMFPGGGIDKGEKFYKGVKRELTEEVGAVLLSGSLKLVATVDWVWFPEWADNEKRKKRYKEFQGERANILIGMAKKFEKPTSKEGDAFPIDKNGLPPLMDPRELSKKLIEYGKNDHPNTYPYRIAQTAVLNSIIYFKECLQ